MSNLGPIRPLSDSVINEIAAGEVIERPASIVKELIENGIDAGAARITVNLAGGGVDSIRIGDDGHGIPPDQLHLAVSRHCTSKLANAEELAAIGSLGFRGEALASITAVAEVSVTSRTATDAHGWRIDIAPGSAPTRPRPEPHAPGTTIEVRGLFATTPARRRFLKRPRTEFLHIQQFVRRAGFCYPGIAFGLVHDGRQNLSLAAPRHASSAERRWRTLFGIEFVAHARRVDVAVDGVEVGGWVGDPTHSRQNSDLQYIAVNRRIVRDRHIAHAVRMAYDTQLEEGRHAAYALHLELPAAAVDVNVHPGKAEVRFRDPRTVHDIVYAAVKQAFSGTAQPDASQGYAGSRAGPDVHGIAETGNPLTRSAPNRRTIPRTSPDPEPPPTANFLLAVAGDRFALCEQDRDFNVMDLHAAIRAVVQARIARGERDARPLIIPETVNAALADERLDALGVLGVEFGRLSERSLVLRAVPVVVNEVDPAAFATALVAALGAGAEATDAIAASAATAFRAPRGIPERRRWFATLEQRLLELGLMSTEISVQLGLERLSALFESNHG